MCGVVLSIQLCACYSSCEELKVIVCAHIGTDLLPFQFMWNPLMTLQILMNFQNQNWIQVSFLNFCFLCKLIIWVHLNVDILNNMETWHLGVWCELWLRLLHHNISKFDIDKRPCFVQVSQLVASSQDASVECRTWLVSSIISTQVMYLATSFHGSTPGYLLWRTASTYWLSVCQLTLRWQSV